MIVYIVAITDGHDSWSNEAVFASKEVADKFAELMPIKEYAGRLVNEYRVVEAHEVRE